MRKKNSSPWNRIKRGPKLIGTCGFIKYDLTEHKAEIAYALSRKYWGED